MGSSTGDAATQLPPGGETCLEVRLVMGGGSVVLWCLRDQYSHQSIQQPNRGRRGRHRAWGNCPYPTPTLGVRAGACRQTALPHRLVALPAHSWHRPPTVAPTWQRLRVGPEDRQPKLTFFSSEYFLFLHLHTPVQPDVTCSTRVGLWGRYTGAFWTTVLWNSGTAITFVLYQNHL